MMKNSIIIKNQQDTDKFLTNIIKNPHSIISQLIIDLSEVETNQFLNELLSFKNRGFSAVTIKNVVFKTTPNLEIASQLFDTIDILQQLDV